MANSVASGKPGDPAPTPCLDSPVSRSIPITCGNRYDRERQLIMTKPPYELIDHTADVGAWAYGPTLAQAFENAALAMYSIMADLSTVAETALRHIEVESDSLEELLVAWLSELLYLSDTQQLLFRRFAVEILDHQPEESPRRLQGRAWGEPIDPDRHALGSGVKAITRHLLAIEQTDEGYRIQVIFDI